MRPWLLAVLLLGLAPAAGAAPFTLVFDGSVTFVSGGAPSLLALGLTPGSPLHYEVLVDRDADGYIQTGDQIDVRPDVWNAPDDHQDNFYAELVAQPYPTPGSYYGWGREFFVGADVVSSAFPGCAVLGRLFVGTDSFRIDGCAPVAEWSQGMTVGSAHIWHDPVTDEASWVYGSLTVSAVLPVPEPGSALLLAAGLAGFGARRRLRVA